MTHRVPPGKLPPTPEAVKKSARVRREFREGAGVYELAVRYHTCIPIIESILRGKVKDRGKGVPATWGWSDA